MADTPLTLTPGVALAVGSPAGPPPVYRFTNPVSRKVGSDLHVNSTGSTDPGDDLLLVPASGSEEVVSTVPLFAWSVNGGTATVRLLTPSGGTATNGPQLAVYNQGLLADFRRKAQVYAAAGGGGISVVVYGDSTNEIYVPDPTTGLPAQGANYLYRNFAHKLKLKLQSRFNPAGVGGYGYLRMVTGVDPAPTGYSNDLWTFDGTVGRGGAYSASNPGLVLTTLQGGTARFAFDGTDPDKTKRLGLRSYEPLYAGNPGNADIVTDVSAANAAIAPGTGAFTASVHPGAASALAFGLHGGAALGLGALDPTRLNVLQLACPGGVGYVEGVFAYDGDEACGVHVHNLAKYGSSTLSWLGYLGDAAQDTRLANIDRMGATALGTSGLPSAKCALAIWNLLINDQRGNVSIATFQGNVALLAQRCQTTACGATVVWIVEPCPNGTAPVAYDPYAEAIYAAARANGIVVIDAWAYIGHQSQGPQGTGAMAALGWYGDGTHMSEAYYTQLAGDLDALIAAA